MVLMIQAMDESNTSAHVHGGSNCHLLFPIPSDTQRPRPDGKDLNHLSKQAKGVALINPHHHQPALELYPIPIEVDKLVVSDPTKRLLIVLGIDTLHQHFEGPAMEPLRALSGHFHHDLNSGKSRRG